MVLANHAYSDLSPSFAGIIDVFFVMSAFLITSLLLQEHRDRSTINMRKFYARRAVRLLPSAYLCIVAWIVFCLLFDRERLVWVLQDAAAAVTYVYNLVFPVGLGYVAPKVAAERSIDQFWSLAVEEQFYLFIAVTVLVCIRRRWMVQLAVVMCALATWIGIQRMTGHTGPWPLDEPQNGPWRGVSLLWLSRPDSLMWGVALAVLNAKLPEPLPAAWRRWLPRVAGVSIFVMFGTMVLASTYLSRQFAQYGLPYPYTPPFPARGESFTGGLYWPRFGHSVAALASVPVLLCMTRHKEWWANRALSWKPVRFMGRMSYTVYVWHTLVYFVLLEALGLDSVLGEKTRVFVLAPVTVVACLPVYYFVEQRALRVKLKFATEKEVLDLNTGKMVPVEELQK
jgi:peptidoglycan/LPS O-acetylase OafA/YrhL